MAGCAMIGQDMLKTNAMTKGHLKFAKYYDKLFQQASDKRIIQADQGTVP